MHFLPGWFRYGYCLLSEFSVFWFKGLLDNSATSDSPQTEWRLCSSHPVRVDLASILTSTVSSNGLFRIVSTRFFVAVIIHVIGGVIINKCLRGAIGLELIPNYEFWADLPSLVKVICIFISHTVDAYHLLIILQSLCSSLAPSIPPLPLSIPLSLHPSFSASLHPFLHPSSLLLAIPPSIPLFVSPSLGPSSCHPSAPPSLYPSLFLFHPLSVPPSPHSTSFLLSIPLPSPLLHCLFYWSQ